MEDKLSLFFLRYSLSKAWLLFGLGALVGFISAVFLPNDIDALSTTLWGKVLITYIVFGTILTWLAAQAYAYKNSHKKWLYSVFIIWPLSYWYLIYIQFFVSGVSNEST